MDAHQARIVGIAARAFGTVLVLAPAGRLDYEQCEGFRGELERALETMAPGCRALVLDLSGVDYVSSAGLRCFMLASQRLKAQGAKVVFAGLRPLVAEIFRISRFDLLFAIYPSPSEALAAVSAPLA